MSGRSLLGACVVAASVEPAGRHGPNATARCTKARVGLVCSYHGLERHEVPQAGAGDIIAITGMELNVSDTLCDPNRSVAAAADRRRANGDVQVNASPFARPRRQIALTSRQLKGAPGGAS